MTMASGLYVPTIRDAMDTTSSGGGIIDMLSASNKVILVTDTHSPDFDTDDLYADIDNELATANGYTQNSKTVGGTPTWALGNAGQVKYSWSAAVEWTASSFTARGMILVAASGGYLICAVTFGSDYTCTSGTFSITAHANGIFYIDLVP